MSKVSKLVFAAFMQHCIEYMFNVAHVKGLESILSVCMTPCHNSYKAILIAQKWPLFGLTRSWNLCELTQWLMV